MKRREGDPQIRAKIRELQKEAARRAGSLQKVPDADVLITNPTHLAVALSYQRGVMVADVQPFSLDILVIQEDQIKLLNSYTLTDPTDFIYHALNTMNQLGLNRESIPIYLSGIIHEEHELFGLLGKYIRQVTTTPYYLEELTKVQILQYMVVSEASKCA